jgi:hypothetical protein
MAGITELSSPFKEDIDSAVSILRKYGVKEILYSVHSPMVHIMKF